MSRLYLLCGFLLFLSTLVAKNKDDPELISKKDQIQENLSRQFAGKVILFEKNNGQYDADFTYRFSNPNACVDFYDNSIVFSIRKVTRNHNPKNIEEPISFEYLSWSINLKNSNNTKPFSENLQSINNINYFNKNGQKIKNQVSNKITYRNVYNNIDLVFYKSKSGELKYDFILKLGSRLSDIDLAYSGVEDLKVSENGKLIYTTKWGVLKEDKPYSYLQSSNNEVDIKYSINKNSVGFCADFDLVHETIVLDPIYVDWSSYFYGTGKNGTTWAYTWVYDLDIDDDDNVYISGITNDRFPGLTNSYDTSTNGFYDAFVCKMAPDGDSILWFSYLGGSSYEYCFTLTVNSKQEPVVSGFTWSSDFPTTPGAFDRQAKVQSGGFWQYLGYVTKFSKNGDSLLFSTFLGGNGSDLIHSMTLDDSSYIYITGETRSSDFPTTPNCFQATYAGNGSGGSYWTGGDAFLTKMKPDGTGLVFSTYVGGYEADAAYEVALSPSKDIYIVGKTASGNFPVTPGSSIFNFNVLGAYDGFICKFKPDGKTMRYSKMMGGTGEDWFEGVFINTDDEAYVAGISKSSDFYTTSKAYQKNNAGGADVVVVKFNALGQNVVYSTYLGGGSDELYYSGFIYNSNVRIAANVREEAIICGISRSSNFPVTSDALMKNNPSSSTGGYWNSSATISKLNYLGSDLLYGTYYGGSSYEVPGANKLKRISCYTNILYGGFTNSSDYPTTTGVFKKNKSSSGTTFFWTGFVSKFRDTLHTDLVELALGDTLVDCNNVYEILDCKNIGADILWHNGSKNQYQIIQDTGLVWVTATYGCDTVSDSVFFMLEHAPTVPILSDDSIYCNTFPSLTLDAKNDTILATYNWSTSDTTQTINITQPDRYWVDIITPNCGTKTDTVNYILKQTPIALLPMDSIFCDTINFRLEVGDTFNSEIYTWNTLDSTNSIAITDTGTYKVVIENVCGIDSSEINIGVLKTPMALLPEDSVFCNSIHYVLKAGEQNNQETYLYSDINNATSVSVVDSFILQNAGFYKVAVSNKCGIAIDSINIGLIINPTLDLGNDTILCDVVYLPLVIGTDKNEEIYTWENGSDTNYRLITGPQYVWAEISNKCATVQDSMQVNLVASPIAALPQDTFFCDNVVLNLDASIIEPSTYLWQDGTTVSPIFNVTNPGEYYVTISNYCGLSSDTIKIGLLQTPFVDLGKDEIFCGAISPVTFTIGLPNNEEQYIWSDNSNSKNATFSTEGKHWVKISNRCGSDSDTIMFSISPNPIVDLGPDTTLCGNFKVVLDAGNPGMRYLWEPYGETTQTLEATEQIPYKVTVFNQNNCKGSDEFEIGSGCVSYSHFPNAFSPNNDGLNDVLKPTLINYEQYSMKVFNRWGQLLFETQNLGEGWDGTYKGFVVPNGVYLYKVNYITTENGLWHNVSGTVNVVR